MGGWDGGTGCDEGAVKRQQMGGEQRPKRKLEPGEDGGQSGRSSKATGQWPIGVALTSHGSLGPSPTILWVGSGFNLLLGLSFPNCGDDVGHVDTMSLPFVLPGSAVRVPVPSLGCALTPHSCLGLEDSLTPISGGVEAQRGH